jgi:hypothetical protein
VGTGLSFGRGSVFPLRVRLALTRCEVLERRGGEGALGPRVCRWRCEERG